MTDSPNVTAAAQGSAPRGRRATAVRRAAGLVALGVVGGALIVGGVLLYLRITRPNVQLPARPTTVALETPYKDEEHWLVSQIVDDLAGMASLASAGRGRGGVSTEKNVAGLLTVSVKPPSGSTFSEALHLEHSVWSPEDYESIASRLLAEGRATAVEESKRADAEALLGRLLEMSADAIQSENERISGGLAAEPLDPRLHEEAALLLGAFALREASGYFADGRPTLCRMTAHLAFARALRRGAPQGLSGRYAAVVLAKLAKRGAEAEAALEKLHDEARGGRVQDAWRRALLMRITDNWRLLPHPDSATMLERFEWLRAAMVCLSGDRSLQMLERVRSGPGYAVDWALILSWSPSVEVGNRFVDAGREQLLAEAEHIWSRTHGSPLSETQHIAALSEPAQLFVSKEGPRVIAWGTWAAQYQRHLLHLLQQSERHERHMLGIRESADRTAAEFSRTFSGLTFFPLLAARWEAEKKAPDRTVLDAAVTFAARHPELVTAYAWTGIKKATRGLPRQLPPPATWFLAGPPRGTGYDLTSRLDLLPKDSPHGPPLASLSVMKALAPRDYYVSYYRLFYKKQKGALTRAEAEAEFGDRLQYDDRALHWAVEWLDESDPAFARVLQGNRCELDADRCGALGAYCVELGDEACAVTAYERMVAEGPDAVRVANNSRWLMNHYLSRGERRRAERLANGAAEVGSETGVLTLSAFLEATGDPDGAEVLIRQARERYPPDDPKDPDRPLIGFYHRMAHVRGKQSYEPKFTKAAKDVFPLGLEQVSVSSLQGAPTDGVVFTSETSSLRRNGMRKGDVAVAWEGLRIRNVGQFRAAVWFSDDPRFTLVVWRSGQYHEINARRVGRSFGMEIANYKPAPAKGPVR